MDKSRACVFCIFLNVDPIDFELIYLIFNLKYYHFACTLKNLAKHSTDFKEDDSESAENKNEDIEENVDKKEKG